MLRKMPVWKKPGMPIEQPATMTSRMNQTRLSSAQRIVAAPGRRAAGSAVVVMRVPEVLDRKKRTGCRPAPRAGAPPLPSVSD